MQNIENKKENKLENNSNKEKIIEHNTGTDPCAPYTRVGSGPPNYNPPAGCVCPTGKQWKPNPSHIRRGIYGCF